MYAFIGLVGFWIDESWALIDVVLDLLPLEGDHSGAASGKAIFKSLLSKELLEKLRKDARLPLTSQRSAHRNIVASAADNASSNATQNRSLCRRILKKLGLALDSDEMQIGCAGHVVHLVVQYVNSTSIVC